MKIDELIVNPEYEQLIPPLTDEEYRNLETSILKEGILYPIIINPSKIILDGHHRVRICKKHNITEIEEVTRKFEDDLDEREFVITINLNRRHLTALQKVELARELFRIEQKRAEKRRGILQNEISVIPSSDIRGRYEEFNEEYEKGESLVKTANKVGIGKDSLWKGFKILDTIEKDEEIADRWERGKKKEIYGDTTINAIYKDIQHTEKIKELEQEIINLVKPEGIYQVIVIDPPWNYGTKYNSEGRRVASPYPEMSLDELLNLDIPYDEEGCVLWLWTTNRFIHDAFHLLEKWGFEPKTILTWVKDKIGLGDWLRGQTEHCIMAIKGTPIINLTNQSTALTAPTREHSRKPDEFYEMVKSLCVGRKLDYYGREERDGWDVFGTMEISKNDNDNK